MRLRLYKRMQILATLVYRLDSAKFRTKLTVDILPNLLGEKPADISPPAISPKKGGMYGVIAHTLYQLHTNQWFDCTLLYIYLPVPASFVDPSTSKGVSAPFNMFKPGHGHHGKLPKKPSDKYKEVFDHFALKCGFKDKFQLLSVVEYLYLNGEYSLVDVSV